MSFLSRRPSRPGNRGSDAGRDDEYDDYAPDGYARGEEDENWSANEYFSPEGIKGRWAAGHQPGDNPAIRGNRENGRDSGQRDQARGYDDASYAGAEHGSGYGAEGYATGAYDLPDGTDEERAERGGRRRKDRGERGSRLRLRRDRGEDIWPDDGVSDEDYWASVAADRPLPPASAPLDADQVPAGGDPRAADPRPVGDSRPGRDSRLAGDPRPGSDPRFGGEQRGGAGRLGQAPGLSGGSGGGWSGQAQRASGGFSQLDGAQPSFKPNGAQAPGGPASARQQDRPDWGERTERIERVTASGYPDPRQNSRPDGATGRGRTDSGSWRAADRREPSRDADREPGRTSGAWPAAARGSGQAPGRAAGDDDPLTSTAYSRAALADVDGRSYRMAARRSQAQSALTDETQSFRAPGSYPGDRYASDRYQTGPRPSGQPPTGEQPTRRYPPGGTGEHGQYGSDQYRGGQPRDAQEATSRYPAYGSQQPAQSPRQGQAAPARQPAQASQPGQPSGNSGRVSMPGASGQSGLTGQYPAQQPRQPQPQPRPQQPRQPAQSALPAGGNPYDTAVTGAYPYPGQTGGYPARPAQPPAAAAPGAAGRDDRRRRQAPPDGYGTGGPDQANPGRGTGSGYGADRDGRY